METLEIIRRHPKKRGPKPKGFERFNLLIAPDLAEWAKAQPDGLSGLVRRLLADERARRAGVPAGAAEP